MINHDGTAQVEFITFSGLGRAALIRHVDCYRAGSCLPECSTQGLAQGPGGYVF
jgi:hypothetical protein